MSTLREAAEKAIAKHDDWAAQMPAGAFDDPPSDAIDALRAELAKPDAPLSAPLLRLGTSMSNLPPLPKAEWSGLVNEGGQYEPEWISYQDGYTGDDMHAYATAALAAQAAELEALRAKVAEWEKLRDPVTLHVSLLRGFPARLPRSVLLHLAGGDAPMPNEKGNRPA